jgi:hypothetical protein
LSLLDSIQRDPRSSGCVTKGKPMRCGRSITPTRESNFQCREFDRVPSEQNSFRSWKTTQRGVSIGM